MFLLYVIGVLTFFEWSSPQRERVGMYSRDILFYSRDILFYTRDVLFYSRDILFYTRDVLFYSRDILFYSRDILFYSRDILFYSRDILFYTCLDLKFNVIVTGNSNFQSLIMSPPIFHIYELSKYVKVLLKMLMYNGRLSVTYSKATT